MTLLIERALMILAAIFVFTFSVATAAQAFRSEIQHRWRWTMASLLGAPVVILNWDTGEMGFRLLAVQLFGVAATRFPPNPWCVAVAFPIGAALFRARRSRLERSQQSRLSEEHRDDPAAV